MHDIAANLARLQQRIHDCEQQYGRVPGSVRLLAVSKTHPPAAIRAALACGQNDFGESYLQEAMAKMQELSEARIEWHFIGPVQANKTRNVAENFSWVHSLDRLKTARRLDAAVPEARPPLNVCIQVNISAEPTKSGIRPDELPDFASAVSAFTKLRIRGLMAMPEPATDFASQRQSFRGLRQCLEQLKAIVPAADTLSMGTTADLEAAIAEGATIVRIGTALFGPRE